MGGECSPRERELSSLKLARRSTMRTSVPASVSSAASIIPVGPPPAITTACSDTHPSSFLNVCGGDSAPYPGACSKPGGRCYIEIEGGLSVSFFGLHRGSGDNNAF